MTAEYISPNETEIEKNRLIKRLLPELKTHGLVDATAFIKSNSLIHENHRHPGFVRSVVYKMESLGEAEVIPLKEWTEFYIKQTVYSKRHPYRFAVILGAIGLLFSVSAGISIAITQTRIKNQVPFNTEKQLSKPPTVFPADSSKV
jgi:hypothetical protein